MMFMFIVYNMFNVYSTAGTVTKKTASNWLGVWVCLMFICDCVGVRRSRRYDFTTFLACYSQRRGGARAGVARARSSLPKTTASRKNERGKRSRDREIAK